MSSSKAAGRAAAVLGALAVAAIPASVAAAQLSARLPLLGTLYVGVAVSGVLALLGVAASRRARFAAARSVRPDSVRAVRIGRLLAWAGLYAAITGGLALAVYGALRLAQ